MLKGLAKFASQSHRTLIPKKSKKKQSRSVRNHSPTDHYTPSASLSTRHSAENKPAKGHAAKWALAGAAIGLTAATLLFPGAGIMAAILSTGAGAVSGAVLSSDPDTAVSKSAKRERFDPYNPNHVSDPRNIFEPNNPLNPIFWDQ